MEQLWLQWLGWGLLAALVSSPSRQVDSCGVSGRELGLGSGCLWQQEDFQVVAASAGRERVHCFNMFSLSNLEGSND